jgi:hypothetical protein
MTARHDARCGDDHAVGPMQCTTYAEVELRAIAVGNGAARGGAGDGCVGSLICSGGVHRRESWNKSVRAEDCDSEGGVESWSGEESCSLITM